MKTRTQCSRCSKKTTIGQYYTKVSGNVPERLCKECWDVLTHEHQIVGHVISCTYPIGCQVSIDAHRNRCNERSVDCAYTTGGAPFFYECAKHSKFRVGVAK